MSENRFILNGLGIIDTKTEQSLSRLELVNMLNHLWNDNQEYLQIIREKNCKTIQRENVKLDDYITKSSNGNCTTTTWDIGGFLDDLIRGKLDKQLEEKNEQKGD